MKKPYLQNFKIAALNCRGLSSQSQRERIIHLMKKHIIDILCLQETKINSNSREIHDGYTMYWSTGISDDARNKADNLKPSGKATIQNLEHARAFRSAIEHLGVGICYSHKVQKYVTNVQQISARNICITLKKQIGDLDIISSYAPQACACAEDASEKHYDELGKSLNSKYAYNPKLIAGDFHARIIQAMPHENSAIGPFTLGKDCGDIDVLSTAQFQNRLRFVEFCLSHDMVVKKYFL